MLFSCETSSKWPSQKPRLEWRTTCEGWTRASSSRAQIMSSMSSSLPYSASLLCISYQSFLEDNVVWRPSNLGYHELYVVFRKWCLFSFYLAMFWEQTRKMEKYDSWKISYNLIVWFWAVTVRLRNCCSCKSRSAASNLIYSIQYDPIYGNALAYLSNVLLWWCCWCGAAIEQESDFCLREYKKYEMKVYTEAFLHVMRQKLLELNSVWGK